MAIQTFSLLASRQGMKASINGATQIRAGVQRPEIIVPLAEVGIENALSDRETTDSNSNPEAAWTLTSVALEVGTPVRIIREPYFGQLGAVTDLLVEPQELETEANVRVLGVVLESQERVILPRANVEIIG